MVSVYWLIGGAVLMALEAFGLPGVGLLFAGLSAILVGVLVEVGLLAEQSYVGQWAVFFLVTTLMAVLLWNRLKSWRLNPNAPHYHNMTGSEAVVTQTLIGDGDGQVRWSGTLMRARLVSGTVAELPVGSSVVIREVRGNLLLVAPK